MSSFDDDDIEFDFFDEPETQEATQRRRLPRLERPRAGGGGRPRRPIRPPAGLTPLLRLLGLVALVIFVVVILVFWTQSCQGASKRTSYEHYADAARTLAQTSDQIGRDLAHALTTTGIKQTKLQSDVSALAQRQQQEVAQAQSIRPPGPLRTEQMYLLQALQLRAAGLSRLAAAFGQTAGSRDASKAGTLLARQARLLTASDVVWDVFFHDQTVAQLKQQGITGVAVPGSSFLPNPDLVSTQSLVQVFQTLHGTTPSGPSGGKHGDGLVSVTAEPAGTPLSTSQATTVQSSTQLAFSVTVVNSGGSREVGVDVKLTVDVSPKPIVATKTIDEINPGEQKTVTFPITEQLPYGPKVNVKVDVAPVPGESNTANNSATYPVFFSVG